MHLETVSLSLPPLSQVEIIVNSHERRVSQRQAINELPLFPDERVLFDRNLVPEENFVGDSVLALPKLNLQFLTMHDYLLRNFQLYRLESTYQVCVRSDCESDDADNRNPQS